MRALAIAALFVGVGVALAPGNTPTEDVAAIRRGIEQIKDSADRRWEQIPWVPTLTEARKLSVDKKLPVFLFTLDGNIRSGRC